MFFLNSFLNSYYFSYLVRKEGELLGGGSDWKEKASGREGWMLGCERDDLKWPNYQKKKKRITFVKCINQDKKYIKSTIVMPLSTDIFLKKF